MSMDTGDNSGATDRESMEPPIGVVGNTDREVMEPPIVVVRAMGSEVMEPPIGVVDAVTIHRMTTQKKATKKSSFTHQPWKARHGCIMSAWDSLLENLFTEKREGACVFEGASVVTICK